MASDDASASSPLEALPIDLHYAIIAWLDATSLAQLLQTCRRVAAYGADDGFWRWRCRDRFPATLVRLDEWDQVASHRDLHTILGVPRGLPSPVMALCGQSPGLTCRLTLRPPREMPCPPHASQRLRTTSTACGTRRITLQDP